MNACGRRHPATTNRITETSSRMQRATDSTVFFHGCVLLNSKAVIPHATAGSAAPTTYNRRDWRSPHATCPASMASSLTSAAAIKTTHKASPKALSQVSAVINRCPMVASLPYRYIIFLSGRILRARLPQVGLRSHRNGDGASLSRSACFASTDARICRLRGRPSQARHLCEIARSHHSRVAARAGRREIE